MGLVKRFLRREDEPDEPCPRCGIPVPRGTAECTACGWDTREAYHGAFTGSSMQVGAEERA
jgi:hypothetical protein